MTTYHWQPLPDPRAWMRVLQLFPGCYTDSLEAAVEIVRLQDKSKYEAISYFWGPDVRDEELLLRDHGQKHVVPITKNLDRALRKMRKESHVRALWTDAICIDQRDEREKPHQVRLMGRIYTDAMNVLVYLGEPKDSTSFTRARELLQKILENANRPSPDHGSNLQWVKDSGLPSVREYKKWEPLKAFFRRPWFRRKWTIQESALATSLEFHCGTWTCDWDQMNSIVATIYDRGLGVTDYTISLREDDSKHLQQGLSQLNSIRLYKQEPAGNRGHHFQQLAYRFQTSDATDNRDHLFALLGMAVDSEHEQLNPEYKESTLAQTCIRYAQFFIQRDATLEVLYRAGLAEYELLAPSWIPNWYGGHHSFGFESCQGVWNPSSRPDHLHVARGTSVTVSHSPNPAIVGIKGAEIGSIKELANEHLSAIRDVVRDKDKILERQRKHLIASDRILNQLEEYPTGQAPEEVMWRTLICNTTSTSTIPDDRYGSAYIAWRRFTLRESASNVELVINKHNMILFDNIYGSSNADKSFGSTCKGLVGMFPNQAKKGDLIAILYGGEFPFVLRPCGRSQPGSYELVGQCYIHGIMEEDQFDLKGLMLDEREFLIE